MLDLSSSFEKAKNWLLSSGLALTEKDDKNCGAIHSFYDIKNKNYGFLYPEITGYYISTLSFLYNYEQKEDYIRSAKSSADWLIDIYQKYGGIIMGIDNDKSKQQLAFSFDTGMCTKGLIDCYQLTHNEKYLNQAKEFADWILNGAVEDDGTIKPFKILEKNEFSENNEVWYKQKGCLNIKTVIPILQLYQITKNNELLDVTNKMCNTYHTYQNDDGSFAIHKGSKTVNLHTQCYALEGLLYAYYITKNHEYLQSCEKALVWCTKKIQDDGGINLWFGSKHQSKAAYAVAQLIRLMVLVDSFKEDNKYRTFTEKLYSFLLTLQAFDPNKKINGGFYEEFYKSIVGWKKRQRINSWGTMFALQALAWYEKKDSLNFDEIKYIF